MNHNESAVASERGHEEADGGFLPLSSAPPTDVASGENAEFVAQMFDQYAADPSSVPADWQAFFAGYALASGDAADLPTTTITRATPQPATTATGSPVGVYDLVHSYRAFGHFEAHLDPLRAEGDEPEPHPLLALHNFGLEDVDLSTHVGNGGFLGHTDGTLGDLIEKLRLTYCGTVGIELSAVADVEQRNWLQQQIEPGYARPDLTPDQQKDVHRQLVQAEEFEQFLHKAFVGSKRFSLEGGESLVPLLNAVVEGAGALDGEQVICSMAHRGRLNVLAHVLGKPLETIIAEFAGTITRGTKNGADYGDGDVKYHLGYAKTRTVCPDGGEDDCEVKVSLLPNPSHLELINPIQQGIIRCKQQWMLDGDRTKVVPVCLHGDAAFCGQGIVFETLNLSELIGYRTGGTIHVIVNNQIGFTTPPKQGRFTPYPTDVAKAIQAPVFHVNGDDPETVYRVARLATAFRQKFKQDVFIDLWCYRKYGHNEADEPAFTQPLMYKAIAKHPGVRTLYEKQLVSEGVFDTEAAKQVADDIVGELKQAREDARVEKPRGKVPSFSGVWNGLGRSPDDYREWQSDTGVDEDTLKKVVDVYDRQPDGFTPHRKLQKLHKSRVQTVRDGEGIDWGTGEMLAIGSLLLEGHSVRVTGQDVERGTFSHRHAVLHDVETGDRWKPLQFIGGGKRHQHQGRFEIINTMLSEEAVVGFEWGFASADPRNLVIWEAQFGDFV
ncbi:MAG: 2-oxoglutarate dehydrogenase E1 component, partial [Planctomycetota bacterium]